jgi:hypothetical protein
MFHLARPVYRLFFHFSYPNSALRRIQILTLLVKTLPVVTSTAFGPNTPSVFFLSLKLAKLGTIPHLQTSSKYFPYPIFTGIPAIEPTPCHCHQTDQVSAMYYPVLFPSLGRGEVVVLGTSSIYKKLFHCHKILRTIHYVSETNCFLLQVQPLILKHNSTIM